jgi:hypothetical protein
MITALNQSGWSYLIGGLGLLFVLLGSFGKEES